MDDLSMDSFSNASRQGEVVRFLIEHPVETGNQRARETTILLVAFGTTRECALKAIQALCSEEFCARYAFGARHA